MAIIDDDTDRKDIENMFDALNTGKKNEPKQKKYQGGKNSQRPESELNDFEHVVFDLVSLFSLQCIRRQMLQWLKNENIQKKIRKNSLQYKNVSWS